MGRAARPTAWVGCNGMNIHDPLAPENTAEEARRTEGRDEDYAVARLHLLWDGQHDNTHLCWFLWHRCCRCPGGGIYSCNEVGANMEVLASELLPSTTWQQ
jgi:hypothetical protein